MQYSYFTPNYPLGQKVVVSKMEKVILTTIMILKIVGQFPNLLKI